MMNDEKQETMDDFLRAFPTTMTSVQNGATPSKKGDQFHFLCTLKCESTSVEVEYHMGIGHVREPKAQRKTDLSHDREGFWVANTRETGWTWKRVVLWPEPDIRDVLSSLALDASTIDNGETFIEFAREMGYESLTEYEEARRCYDGCHEALAKLRRLYGRKGTERLIYETEGR